MNFTEEIEVTEEEIDMFDDSIRHSHELIEQKEVNRKLLFKIVPLQNQLTEQQKKIDDLIAKYEKQKTFFPCDIKSETEYMKDNLLKDFTEDLRKLKGG